MYYEEHEADLRLTLGESAKSVVKTIVGVGMALGCFWLLMVIAWR